MYKKYVPVVLFTILILAFGALVTIPVLAESANQLSLNPTEDTYTDIFEAGSTHNSVTLFAASSDNIDPAGPDTPTTYIWLKFDLSSVPWTIDKARLNLATVLCIGTGSVDPMELEVFGVDDDNFIWAADTLTYNLQSTGGFPTFTRGSGLVTLDEASILNDAEDYYHFTDSSGAGALASYLEAEHADGGNGTATLVVMVSSDAGTAVTTFEDQEQSAGTCPGSGTDFGPPILQVSDGDQPLAVSSLSASASNDSKTNPYVWAALVLVVVAASGLALATRKQTEAS